MRRVKGALLASLYGVFCGGIFCGGMALGNPGVNPEVNSTAQSGVLLGSDSYQERERARTELWSKGPEAVNLLNAMAISDEPELSWRARQILRWVDMEMTPETPPEIVALVERYLIVDNARERDSIFHQLLEKKAYMPLFRLPKHIADKEVSTYLAEQVAELASQVAIPKILAGDDEEALAILAEANHSQLGHLRWVALASAMGKRDALWSELSAKDKMRFARWEGDLTMIRTLATPEHEIQLTLQLLDGEVLPYLNERSLSDGRVGLRARMAKALLMGQEDSEENRKSIARLTSPLAEGGRPERDQEGWEQEENVLRLLCQLGYVEEARPFLEARSPVEMFEYYHGMERLADAFRVLGLKVGEPIPAGWIAEALAKVEGEFDLENEGCRRLASVGQFLVERGEFAEAEKLFNALEVAMSDLGLHEINNFLRFLSGERGSPWRGYPELAIRKAMARKEEPLAPEAFLSEAFFDDESPFILYHFLGKRDGEMAEWRRVRAVFAAYGRQVDFPVEELAAILREFEVSATENPSRGQWTVLREIAIFQGKVALLERSVRAMGEFEDDDAGAMWGLGMLLFSDGRFGEAAEVLLKLQEDEPNRLEMMKFVAVTLEASGKVAEAQEWLLMVEKLALGDGRWLVSLGNIWGLMGEWERQHELYERAFLLLPAKSLRWFEHLPILAESARKVGAWKQAAACQEVYNAYLSLDGLNDPWLFVQMRSRVDFARAMAAFEDGEMARGEEIFARLIGYSGFEIFFADDVFPVLRQEGLHEQAERVWAHVSPVYRHSMAAYPDGHNAFNTSAWVAARAACDLDLALVWIDRALQARPNSSAYLDTRGEVLFAQGKREEALVWSKKSCQNAGGERELGALRVQYRHFRDDPYPLPLPLPLEPVAIEED